MNRFKSFIKSVLEILFLGAAAFYCPQACQKALFLLVVMMMAGGLIQDGPQSRKARGTKTHQVVRPSNLSKRS